MIIRTSGLAALACSVGLAFAMPATAGDENRYIIQFAPGGSDQGVAAVQAFGGQIKVDLTDRSIHAIAATLPEQALNGLQNNPSIISIEPDGRIYPMADQVPYGIGMVQADLVSDEFAGNQNICVIDSGYHIDHADLQSNGVTATQDSGSGDPYVDPCGHGTHVTGTISALANGGGVLGVLPSGEVNLHIVKVFGDSNWDSGSCGWSYSSNLIDAAYECADAGSNVINMSLGGGTSSSAEAQAFQDLFDQGILPIAAAGNDGNTAYSYPASYDAVISVAAIDSDKELASFSQRNDQVELSAPGVGVLSTTPFADAAAIVGNDSYQVSAIDRAASTTGEGDLVDGGLCTSSDSWNGQVVLCERGEVSFSDKVSNVESGGGVAAIIYNNESGNFAGTLDCNGPPHGSCSSVPAVSMSQEDGQDLVGSSLGSEAFVSTIEVVPGDGYAAWQGTSMASPHVAAVAALVWSYAPDMSPTEVRDALAASAEDLGSSGRNDEFGYGLVQAQAALDYIGGDNGGGSDPDPHEPPTADFTYSCDDLDCNFDGSTSTDGDGAITSYDWTFGDNNSASGVTTSHSYAGEGSYTVTLTVTDDEGESDSASTQVTVSDSDDGGAEGIELSGDGYKVRGRWTTDLNWEGAEGSQVDIIREGSLLTTVSNSGEYTDSTNFNGSGTLTYQVCETDASECSDSITVSY